MSAAPLCSAISTVDSKPYMCCGATVATMLWRRPSSKPSLCASARTLRTRPPQLLRWATGTPVEPEVKTIAAMFASGIEGISKAPVSGVSPAITSPHAICGRSIAWAWSVRQKTSGAKCLTCRTISGVSAGGSRLIRSLISAAAMPTANR